MARPHQIAALVVLAVLVVAPAPASAAARAQEDSDPAAGRSAAPDAPGTRRHELEERWAHKTPEERELLRQRFEALKDLPPDEKAELRARFDRLSEIEREVRENASDADRARAEQLSPQRARDFWRQRAVERTREAGQHLRERLPDDLRQRLEDAPPQERREILRQMREKDGDRRSRRAVHDLGRRLHLPPDRIDALLALPLDERFAAVVALKREQIEERVRTEGLPPGLDEERWGELQQASDEEFVEAFHRWRDRARPLQGGWRPRDGAPGGDAGRGRRDGPPAGKPGDRPDGKPDGRPGAPRDQRTPDGDG